MGRSKVSTSVVKCSEVECRS